MREGLTEPSQDRPTLVWVLVPVAETIDGALDYYNDYSQSRAEFERAFLALGIAWRWQPVTMRDYRKVIDGIVQDAAHEALVFNLCDGDEDNGVPGISVVRYLSALRISFTGADERFYDITTSKIDMKRAFDRASVCTPSWEIVTRSPRTRPDIFARHGCPLIVKPAVSAGSMGITVNSVVETCAALDDQLDELHAGYKGWNLVGGGVFVERYVAGREFTTFIVGSADEPHRATVYPSVERVFHESLPPAEQFLSYDRLWEVYERESPIGDGEYLWQYRAAPDADEPQIAALAWAAYVAVGGRGYGRVDIRMDAATGELFVLEVNSQCGLSEDEDHTSIGAILRYAQRPFATMLQNIMDTARMVA